MSRNAIVERLGGQIVFRSSATGRFISIRRNNQRKTSLTKKRSGIKNGVLYSFKGQTVRALQLCPNGLRLVGSHGSLFGFVRDKDLAKISSEKVEKCLRL